jgi:hypothetical protein
MTAKGTGNADTAARWDGRRVLFELQHGAQAVPCAISPGVLRELTSQRCFKREEVLQCFTAVRAQVEAIAHGKLRQRVAPFPMPLTIWSNDVEDYEAVSGETAGRAR